jgi:hypothetical protein
MVKILKELPITGIKCLIQLLSSGKSHRSSSFPSQENLLTSFPPISLLPIVTKFFEVLLLKRLLPVVENNRLILNHQFGQRHSTIEQTYGIVRRINEAIEI